MMNRHNKSLSLGRFRRLIRLPLRASLLGTLAVPLSSIPGFAQTGKPAITAPEAVLGMLLAHRGGAAPLYYSACCRARAVEIQKSVEDELAFYKEKLGIRDQVSVAVLDAHDWSRVTDQMPDRRFNPYGMTNNQVAPSGYMIFIPADDNGVITQHLMDIRRYATADNLKLLASAHLTYVEAVHRVILQTAHHETGHTLVYQYGIGQTNHFLNEILANYFAYAYAKARDQETATVSDAFVQMPTPPGTYSSLEDFEAHYANIQPGNYGWYQLQFGLRAQEVYKEQGLGFLAKVRRAFPKGTPEMSVAETLSRLEAISPGWEDWTRKLAGYKREAAPPATARQ